MGLPTCSGCTARCARRYDGPSAVKSALDAVPDLILCDLGLPGAWTDLP